MAQRTLLWLCECRMQLVHDLLEDIGRYLLSLVVEEVYFDAPCAHREALDLLWDIWQDSLLGDNLHLSFNLFGRDQQMVTCRWRMRNGVIVTSGMSVFLLPAVAKWCEESPQARRVGSAVGGCSWRLVMVGGMNVCRIIYVARRIYAI